MESILIKRSSFLALSGASLIFSAITIMYFVFEIDSIYFLASCMLVFAFYAIWCVGFDLANPVTLYLSLFSIYVISPPILIGMGFLTYKNTYPYAIWMNIFASFCFFMFSYRKSYALVIPKLGWISSKSTKYSLFIISTFIVALCLYYDYFILSSGFTSKPQRALSTYSSSFLGFSFYMLSTVLTIIAIRYRVLQNRWPSILILCVVLFVLISFLITGERNYLFKLLIALVVIYQIYEKKIGGMKLLAGLILGIFIVTSASSLKMVLAAGELTKHVHKGIIYTVFHGEFKSSERNLAILMSHVPKERGFTYGKSAYNDIIRVFVPNFIVPVREFPSTTDWFNKLYFPGYYRQGFGVGFSLVGVGYLNFGIVGVFVLFSLLGFITKLLYNKASASAVYMVIYANFIAVLMATIRYDLSGPLSQTSKHILLVVFLVWVASKIISHTYMRISSTQAEARLSAFS